LHIILLINSNSVLHVFLDAKKAFDHFNNVKLFDMLITRYLLWCSDFSSEVISTILLELTGTICHLIPFMFIVGLDKGAFLALYFFLLH